MIIDNVGFDVKAMSLLTEKQFIDTHLSNDAICRGKSVAERRDWLRAAHAAIKSNNKGQVQTPAPLKNDGKRV